MAPGQEYDLQVALRLCAEQVSRRLGHTGYEEYTFSVVYKSILKWLQAGQAFQGPGLGLVSQPYFMNFIYLSYKGKNHNLWSPAPSPLSSMAQNRPCICVMCEQDAKVMVSARSQAPGKDLACVNCLFYQQQNRIPDIVNLSKRNDLGNYCEHKDSGTVYIQVPRSLS